jgi:hypothetical protein
LEERQSIIDLLDKILKQIKVAADLIGGVALQYYGYKRYTEDIDLLIDRSNYDVLANAIINTGGFSLGKNNRFELNNYQIQICYDGLKVGDTIFPKPSSSSHGLNVISLKILLKMKMEAGMNRAKDRADFIELIKRGKISKEYIETELFPILSKMQQRTALVLWNKASKEPP